MALPAHTRAVFPLHILATPLSGAIADDTKTTLVAAPAAGLATVVTMLTVFQTGATQAVVHLFDGNTIIWRIPLTTEWGSGLDSALTIPLTLTAATLLAIQSGAATTYEYSVQTVTVDV